MKSSNSDLSSFPSWFVSAAPKVAANSYILSALVSSALKAALSAIRLAFYSSLSVAIHATLFVAAASMSIVSFDFQIIIIN